MVSGTSSDKELKTRTNAKLGYVVNWLQEHQIGDEEIVHPGQGFEIKSGKV